MNNKEFISELARKLGYTNKETTQLLSSAIGVMTQELQEGKLIAIQGFGSFEVKTRTARVGRNPKTQELIDISECKYPAFSAGKALKDAVNK